MKQFIFTLCIIGVLGIGKKAKAQFITNDPIHTSITSLIKMFQDPSFKTLVGNIEQLKKVSSAVRQFHRGTEIIQSVSRITSGLNGFSTALAKDGHIYPVEYALMSKDIQVFVKEASKIVKDMKAATTASGGVLKMTDAERAKWLEDTYKKISSFERGINSYFNRIKSASIQRSMSKADLTATKNLYSFAVEQPKPIAGGENVVIPKNGYDATYNDTLKIPLDYLYKTQAYENFLKKQRLCEFKNQMFYRRQELAAKNMEGVALQRLLDQGYKVDAKPGFLQFKADAQFQLSSYLNAVANDTTNIAAYGQTTGGGTINTEQLLEKEILAIYDPSGKRISPEIFQMQIEYLAKEIYLEYNFDEKLEKELGIEECKRLAQDFDNVMKAAEAEYLSKNPQY